MKTGNAAILMIGLVFFSACAGIKKPLPDALPDLQTQLEAQRLLSFLMDNNANLETFKGIGKIKVNDGKKTQVTRLAWVASEPAKLRIELLAFTGQPIASLATDGQWIYLISHSPKRFHKKRLTDDGLRQFIALPIKSQEVIALMTGRVALPAYRYAVVQREGFEHIIVLLDHGGRILEKIFIDDSKKFVQKTEKYDDGGKLVYRAQLENFKLVDHFQVPFRMIISNDDAQVQLEIDKYWANVPVSQAMFILMSP